MMASRGSQLLSAAWRTLRQDRELLALPIIGAVASTVAIGLITGVALVAGAFDALLTSDSSGPSLVAWAFAFVTSYVATFIAVFAQAAVAYGAAVRMDGGDPTIASSVAGASARLGRIAMWALVATTVGVLLRAARERLGGLVSFLASMAWAVATFFVVPVLVFEDSPAWPAIGRSTDLIRSKWGPSVRVSVRLGVYTVIATVLSVALVIFGVNVAIDGSQTAGGILAAIGVVLVAAISVVSSALSGYVKVALYRYATDQPVPGITPEILAGGMVRS